MPSPSSEEEGQGAALPCGLWTQSRNIIYFDLGDSPSPSPSEMPGRRPPPSRSLDPEAEAKYYIIYMLDLLGDSPSPSPSPSKGRESPSLPLPPFSLDPEPGAGWRNINLFRPIVYSIALLL